MSGSRRRFLIILTIALSGAAGSVLHAQETVFNVPSADVLGPGAVYLETDYYRPSSASDDAPDATYFVRGVFGIGSDVELGFNSGPFAFGRGGQPFLDASVKWRPINRSFGKDGKAGSFGVFVGDNLGVGLADGTSGDPRSLGYAAGFVSVTKTSSRFSAGPYLATQNVFGARSQVGGQLTVEQSIPKLKSLVLAADWFSGRGGLATVGAIWTLGSCVLYTAYGFANDGRSADLITLELGINVQRERSKRPDVRRGERRPAA